MKFFFSRLKRSVTSIMSKVGLCIDNVLFNTKYTCNLCKKEIFDGEDFCSECYQLLEFNDKCICETCGRRVPISMKRCLSCKTEWLVDKARSAFIYESEIKRLVTQYKYGGKRYLADIFTPYLVSAYIKNAFFCDLITNVPMTKQRLFERGFNHSEHLARSLAKNVGVEHITLVRKEIETVRQAGLNKEERRKNLQKSFKITDKKAVIGKNILIVDDVLTTGATSGELARLLKKSGAKTVSLLTLASTVIDK